MIVRTLQKRFTFRDDSGHLHIIPGKIGTIRAAPWVVSVTYDIRVWTGLPYRSKQEHVAFVEILTARPVTVTPDGVEGSLCTPYEDGFNDWPDMRTWFEKTHTLPFTGWHMLWQEVPA
jgi:hypothetical protein